MLHRHRGDELVNNAVRLSVQRADELNRIYSRHEHEVGKPFDSSDFNAFLEKPEVKARGYRSITDAYNDYVADVWYAPAGLNRGILNCLSVCDENGNRLSFSQGDRDTLYAAQINPLQVFAGSGRIMTGSCIR